MEALLKISLHLGL